MSEIKCKRAFLEGFGKKIELVGPSDWVDEMVSDRKYYGYSFLYEENVE